jgi:hypothetical protein
MCQTTSINLENKTVTIDELQLEHIDKGLRNEQLQREEIIKLKEIVRKKDSVIAVLNKKYEGAINKVFSLSESIVSNQSDLNDATETELETERKKRTTGFYAFSKVSGNKNKLAGSYFGLQYISNKMLYSFSIDPFTYEDIVFSAGIGFKIF